MFSVVAVLIILLPSQVLAQLIISEFRVRGPNGANDEYIEIYNNSGADHTVAAASGSGYGIAASDGITRCTIPNGTVIPNGGHFLCVNSVGYSLASYPAGTGTTATGDATYTTDIPDNAGIALFNNNTGGASYSLANRMDAVGSTSEPNTLYKEGTGYPALVPFNIDDAWVRDACGKSGSIIDSGPCTQAGAPKDTDDNAADFIFVDTNGTSAGAGQRLGAPGPETMSSPISHPNASISNTRLDPCAFDYSSPNFVRNFTSDPASNSTFGTVEIRRTFTNNTGGNINRLRFRILDLTTFPAPTGTADLRPRTSVAVVETVDRPPCGSGTSNVTVEGTILEQPPFQPNGGGFNSSFSVNTVSLATANGASIDVRFLFGVQQTGAFRLAIIPEALPAGGAASDVLFLSCHTETGCAPAVTSIIRADADPTDAASVNFTVTFDREVTGVDASDFDLTTTGVVGASIAGVGGSGTTYTVTVNTGEGNGTIGLDLIDDDTIVDLGSYPLGGIGAGNGNFTTGEVYTVVKPPNVTATMTAVLESGPAIRYTVTLTNSGGDATDVMYADPPAANTTLRSGSVTTTQGTIVTGNGAGETAVLVNVGTMAYNATVTISYLVDINPGVPAGTVLLNQGTVSGGNFADVPTDDPGNASGTDDPTGITIEAKPIPALDLTGLLMLVLLIAAAGALILSRR